MKKYYIKSNGSVFKTGLILLVACISIIYGCRKDISKPGTNPLTVTNPKVTQAKAWYDKAFPKHNVGAKSTVTNSIGDFDLSQFFKPDWVSAKNYSRFGDDVLEIALDDYFKIALKISTSQQSQVNSRSSLLILRNDEEYSAYVMTIVGTPEYINGDLSKLAKNTYGKRDDNFSGIVYYTNPQGKFVSGWSYKNGAIKGQLIDQISTSTNTGRLTTQSLKNNRLEFIEICTEWFQQRYDDEGRFLRWEWIGESNCHTEVQETPDPGNPSPTPNPPGGGGTPGGGPPDGTPGPGCVEQSVSSVKEGKIINTIKVRLLPPGDGGFPPPNPPKTCPVTKTKKKVPIFGINNSNAVIPEKNFADLLKYLDSQGIPYSNPYKGTLTHNGIEYKGQFIDIKNPDNTIVHYFTPDVNGGPFQTGMQYAIGPSVDTSNSIDTSNSFNLGEISIPNTSSYLGTGVVTYMPTSGAILSFNQRQTLETADNNRLLQLLQQEDAKDDAAASPCHGTARNGNVKWQGTLEHWLIQFDYMASNPLALKEYYIPGSSGKLNGNPGYADIANPATGEIFEIKPDNPTGQAAGSAEVQIYLNQANSLCPRVIGGGWSAGGNYPTRNLPDPRNPANVLISRLFTNGVIVYRSTPRSVLPQTVPVPVTLPETLSEKLKNLFQQIRNTPTTMQQQIIVFVRQNPQVIPYLKGTAAAIILGTILEDVITDGAGIANDWQSFLIAKTLWRVANGIVII